MGEETPLEPVTLDGRIVRLEPMSLDHLDGLAAVAFDPSVWRWTTARITDRAGLEAWLRSAVANREAGTELPFVTVEQPTGRPIGSTRFLNVALDHRRVEIGWTWLAAPWRRTGANREAKLLMLDHAFERLGCRRVEFKTDSRNQASRAALVGVGATFEGIFRKHVVMPENGVRHSAWYSIVDDEWPDVRRRLTRLVDEAVDRGSTRAAGAEAHAPSAIIGADSG